MDRNKRRVTKVVKIMTNPNPEFVSMVGHPANQTPFKAVRLDPRFIEEAANAAAAHELAQRSGASEVVIHRIAFDRNVFKAEETVRSYLDTRCVTNYSLETGEKYFEVAGVPLDDIEGDVEQIPAQRGVTMYVGRTRKSAAEPVVKTVNPGAEKAMSVARSTATPAEVVHRYDTWLAGYSDEKTIGAVIKAGSWDGFPPGFYEVAYAFQTAMSNALRDKDEVAVKALGDEFTGIILKLVKLFDALTPEEVERFMDMTTAQTNAPVVAAETAAKTAPAVVAPANTEAPVVATAPVVAPAAATTDAGTGADTVQKTGLAPDFTGVMKQMLDGVGTAVATAIAPIVASQKATDAALAELTTLVTKSNDRLGAVEAATGQTRKSADIEETTLVVDPEVAKKQAEKAAKRAERERRGLFGS